MAKQELFFCNKEELTSESFLIKKINDKEVGGILINDKPTFVLNYCPHEGAEICKGFVNNFVFASRVGKTEVSEKKKVIVCPWHKWEFDPDTGKPILNSKGKLKLYEYTIKQDKIYLVI